jgi:hypothetical protein
MSDDLDELLAHLRQESDRQWRTAMAFRYVYPEWAIRQAQQLDRWIAAVDAVCPENDE